MRKADNIPPYCAVVKKSRCLDFLTPLGLQWPVTGVLYCMCACFIVCVQACMYVRYVCNVCNICVCVCVYTHTYSHMALVSREFLLSDFFFV